MSACWIDVARKTRSSPAINYLRDRYETGNGNPRLSIAYFSILPQGTLVKTYVELDEVERMEAEATCLRDRLLIRLLFRLGCRVSEALAVKVQDIDFDQGTVTILHLKSCLRLSCPHCQARLGKSHSYCPKCGAEVVEPVARAQESKRQRTLPLDPETLAVLEDFVRRDGTKGLIFSINRHLYGIFSR